MTKEVLKIAAPPPRAEQATPRPAARPAIGVALAALALAVGLGMAANLYALILLILGGGGPSRIQYLHIGANTCANLVVAIGAWTRRGQLHEKFSNMLGMILWAHGLLALVIVLTHSSYSNIVMLCAVAVSGVLGVAATLMSQRLGRPRVALLGPVDELGDQIVRYAEHVTSPSVDLRQFDPILTNFADEIPAEWAKAISTAMLAGRRVRHASEYLEESRGLVLPEHFDVELLDGGLSSYETGKRLLDLALVVLCLPFALLILGVAALAIKLTMGGPVIFRQERLKRGGRVFRMLKLRTMSAMPSEPATTAAATQRADPRVTGLGRFLRRMRIDELPQLWHVLVGDMSLIGPRPEWTVLAEDYVEQVPVYAFRHLVRPGLTGWAQVRSGYAGDLRETRLKLAYDLYYVKHFSFALDLQILLRTVWIVCTGFGSR